MNTLEHDRRETLQAKKHDVVRHEIWTAAIDLFHDQGFDNVTVDQIASRAGVSRRTFFRYFGSKDDVMASITRGYGAALIEIIGAADPALPAIEIARSAIKDVLAGHLEITARLLRISERSRTARVAQFLEVPILEQDLAAAFARREAGQPRSRIEHRILASLTLSATGFSAEIWVAQPDRPLPEIVDEVFSALTKVCCAPHTKPRSRTQPTT